MRMHHVESYNRFIQRFTTNSHEPTLVLNHNQVLLGDKVFCSRVLAVGKIIGFVSFPIRTNEVLKRLYQYRQRLLVRLFEVLYQ